MLQVPIKQQELLGIVGQIEENKIDGFPFEVPAEFAKMPLLKGRATLEMKVRKSASASSVRPTCAGEARSIFAHTCSGGDSIGTYENA